MSSVYTPPQSTLLYGGPGAGKTSLACSSFYDYNKGKIIANGKLITFGGEDNPALEIPEECRVIGDKGTSLRLVSPKLDSRGFADTFHLVLLKIMDDAKKGNPLDVLVIDGLSEFDLLYETTSSLEGFDKWGELLDRMFATMTLANHNVLGCQVIMTARVAEKRSARPGKSPGLATSNDPQHQNFDYYPSLRGQFRLHLPHYFGMVLYLETVQALAKDGPYKGKFVPKHITNVVRTGSFYVKNQWEHKWLNQGLPLALENVTWPGLWAMLTQVNTKEEG